MKILTSQHLKEADQYTMQHQNITFLELMERAGKAVFELIDERLQGNPVPIHIFCGLGNNGGDGLVVARYLVEHGYHVTTYIVNFSTNRTEGFLTNFEKLKEIVTPWPVQIKGIEGFPEIPSTDIVIDAIFGQGLNRPIESWVKQLIKYLNNTKCFKISVDVPSGLKTEEIPEDQNAVIYADSCLTFQAPKLVFFLPETAGYVNEVEILDIGLDQDFFQNIETGIELIGKQEALSLYMPREKFAHKGTYGHSLMIGGSKGKIGSVVLASKACMRVGAGLTTVMVPECGCGIVQTTIPEVMVITNNSEAYITDFKVNFKPNAIGVGVGLGVHSKTVNAFKIFLKENNGPLILDADALNILAENKLLLELMPENTILTPHPKELERLIGVWKDDFDKIEKTKAFSNQYKCIVLIKGAHSITVYRDHLFVNTTGNPGMATAGSGDVLAGIITGLVSQGYDPINAVIFGVYLHGLAGDLAIRECGYQALLASDIVAYIGKAYMDLFAEPEMPTQEAK